MMTIGGLHRLSYFSRCWLIILNRDFVFTITKVGPQFVNSRDKQLEALQIRINGSGVL